MSILDEMVCFSLYSASRASTRVYSALLQPWGLTYTQYLVLVVLSAEGPQSVKDLGAKLQLDSGTLSPLLRRLEDKGFIRRERGLEDSRVVLIALSDEGRMLHRDLVQVAEGFACASGIDGVDEAHRLIKELNQLTESMQKFLASTQS